jgi:dolichol kinase
MALGLSSSQVTMAAITILCALLAASSGLLSWHVWRRTRRRSEDQSGESLRTAPFWALGGVFLSSVFFIAVLLVGGLAVGLGTPCVA